MPYPLVEGPSAHNESGPEVALQVWKNKAIAPVDGDHKCPAAPEVMRFSSEVGGSSSRD